MSADSRTTNVWSPVNQHRPYGRFTHRPSTEFVCCSPCSQCTLCWTGCSSFILSTLSASRSVWKAQNVSVSDTCMLKQTEEAASTFTRGQHNTFNLESFTPDVTSNWFLSHFNITHQNTESSPVRPQEKHIHGFNIKNQQIFSSLWINCKLYFSLRAELK